VDDTFVIWPRGTEELQKFHQHTNIKFTVDRVTHESLPFLDILAKKKKKKKKNKMAHWDKPSCQYTV
jgi:hypothetical protein